MLPLIAIGYSIAGLRHDQGKIPAIIGLVISLATVMLWIADC